MKAIEEVLNDWADYEKIREFLKKEKGIIQISGCVDAGKAHMVYGVGNGFGKKMPCVVHRTVDDAASNAVLNRAVQLLPVRSSGNGIDDALVVAEFLG